jgi:hypothetical protein
MIHTATLVHTATPAPAARPAVSCALDRHFGPFEAIPELQGWMGTDWFNCRACRSTLTLATVAAQRFAA